MLLEIQNVKSSYGLIPAIHEASFYAKKGEILGILGHNGMGKTTLLKTIMGFVKLNTGSIILSGEIINNLTVYQRAERGIGLVPQGRDIFPNLTVEQNMVIGIAAQKGDVELRLNESLKMFPRLKTLINRRGGDLSGGEQQLLALARCLCRKPKLMLLDEPTEGIQPSIIDEIGETLSKLSKTGRITIVLVEQNLDFITSLCKRVYAISNGVLKYEIPEKNLTNTNSVSEYMGFS